MCIRDRFVSYWIETRRISRTLCKVLELRWQFTTAKPESSRASIFLVSFCRRKHQSKFRISKQQWQFVSNRFLAAATYPDFIRNRFHQPFSIRLVRLDSKRRNVCDILLLVLAINLWSFATLVIPRSTRFLWRRQHDPIILRPGCAFPSYWSTCFCQKKVQIYRWQNRN